MDDVKPACIESRVDLLWRHGLDRRGLGRVGLPPGCRRTVEREEVVTMRPALVAVVHEIAQADHPRRCQTGFFDQFATRRRLGHLAGIDETAWKAQAFPPRSVAIAGHRHDVTVRLYRHDQNEATQFHLPEIGDHMVRRHLHFLAEYAQIGRRIESQTARQGFPWGHGVTLMNHAGKPSSSRWALHDR